MGTRRQVVMGCGSALSAWERTAVTHETSIADALVARASGTRAARGRPHGRSGGPLEGTGSTHGEPFRLQTDAAGTRVPSETLFRARGSIVGREAPLEELRGMTHRAADPVSLAGVLPRRAIFAIQRERGR